LNPKIHPIAPNILTSKFCILTSKFCIPTSSLTEVSNDARSNTLDANGPRILHFLDAAQTLLDTRNLARSKSVETTRRSLNPQALLDPSPFLSKLKKQIRTIEISSDFI
jgi:hypothetical protein